MPTLRRLSAYLLVFIVLLGVLAATNLWRPLDYFVYHTFYLDDSTVDLHNKIYIIDIPYKPASAEVSDRLVNYRERLTDLLGVIADRGVGLTAVILDIWISKDNRALPGLIAAIERLKEIRVKVYAVFNLKDAQGLNSEQLWERHLRDFYGSVMTGYGHSLFYASMGVLSYKSEIEIPAGTETGSPEIIESLPVKVAAETEEEDRPPVGEYVLAQGEVTTIDAKTYTFTHEGHSTSGGTYSRSGNRLKPDNLPDWHGKILLIASADQEELQRRRFGSFKPQAGHRLFAMALSEQLNDQKGARQPLNHPLLILGQILFFALFTVLLFALLFKYVKRLQTKPLLIACLSVGIGVVLLAIVDAAILTLDKVTPVGLTLSAMVLAAILAWRFAFRYLVAGVAEGAGKYDVFISYSRQHGDWVEKNIYQPLIAMRNSDGDKLSIFFDKTGIDVGEAFTDKYMWAIVDSRFFMPVFSEGYYDRNHCRNEMKFAYKRYVEQKIKILPIADSIEAVPEIYASLNYLVAQANPAFIEDIRKTLLDSNTNRKSNRP